eukprot:5465301-Pyramimonas_sp.AAC.1
MNVRRACRTRPGSNLAARCVILTEWKHTRTDRPECAATRSRTEGARHRREEEPDVEKAPRTA